MFKIANPKRRAGVTTTRESIKHVARFAAFPELAVLPAGALTVNGQGNIAVEAFSGLIDAVAKDFDVILVDTPAACESPDAQALALCTQGAILVARSGKTAPDQLSELDASLQHAGVALMGLVFNER